MTRIKPADDRHKPSKTERGIMALSVLVTLLLVGYALYHVATAPGDAELEATVDRLEETPDGVRVHLRLKNPATTGFRSATLEADCADPPPQVTIDHVPASDERRAHVLCPPDTDTVQVTVASAVPT